MILSFQKKLFEHYIEKKPVRCGEKLSTLVADSTECHVLGHGDKVAKCINCAANHLLAGFYSVKFCCHCTKFRGLK